jgi:hypothetical protein
LCFCLCSLSCTARTALQPWRTLRTRISTPPTRRSAKCRGRSSARWCPAWASGAQKEDSLSAVLEARTKAATAAVAQQKEAERADAGSAGAAKGASAGGGANLKVASAVPAKGAAAGGTAQTAAPSAGATTDAEDELTALRATVAELASRLKAVETTA